MVGQNDSRKPCCTKLKGVLEDTYLSNPNYREDELNVIEIDSDVEVDQ